MPPCPILQLSADRLLLLANSAIERELKSGALQPFQSSHCSEQNSNSNEPRPNTLTTTTTTASPPTPTLVPRVSSSHADFLFERAKQVEDRFKIMESNEGKNLSPTQPHDSTYDKINPFIHASVWNRIRECQKEDTHGEPAPITVPETESILNCAIPIKTNPHPSETMADPVTQQPSRPPFSENSNNNDNNNAALSINAPPPLTTLISPMTSPVANSLSSHSEPSSHVFSPSPSSLSMSSTCEESSTTATSSSSSSSCDSLAAAAASVPPWSPPGRFSPPLASPSTTSGCYTIMTTTTMTTTTGTTSASSTSSSSVDFDVELALSGMFRPEHPNRFYYDDGDDDWLEYRFPSTVNDEGNNNSSNSSSSSSSSSMDMDLDGSSSSSCCRFGETSDDYDDDVMMCLGPFFN